MVNARRAALSLIRSKHDRELLEECTWIDPRAIVHWSGLDAEAKADAMAHWKGRLNTAGITRDEVLIEAVRLEWLNGTEEGRQAEDDRRAREKADKEDWDRRPLNCDRCREPTDWRARVVFGETATCFGCAMKGAASPPTGIHALLLAEAERNGFEVPPLHLPEP